MSVKVVVTRTLAPFTQSRQLTGDLGGRAGAFGRVFFQTAQDQRGERLGDSLAALGG